MEKLISQVETPINGLERAVKFCEKVLKME
jgi:hypothetical protein